MELTAIREFRTTFPGRVQKIILMILLVLLGGCSARGLLMSNAKFFFMRGVDQYFDLDNAQEAELGRIYDRQVVRWRQSFIPRIRAMTDAADKAFSSAAGEQAFLDIFLELEDIRRAVLLASIDDVGGFFVSLRPDQIDRFEKEIREGNESIEEDLNLDPKSFLEARRKKTERNLERWFGALRDDEAKILDLFRSDKTWGQRSLAARLSFQKNLIETIRHNMRSKAGHKKWLEDFATNQEFFYGAEYRPYLKERRLMLVQSLAQFSSVATDAHRHHFSDAMKSLSHDLSKI